MTVELTEYQNVFIKLADGREIKATVPAFHYDDEKMPEVTGIEITKPMPLDDGQYWSKESNNNA